MMKAIVFTIDAVFALLIAAAGISVLLYFFYASPIPYNLQYSSSSGLMSMLATTRLGSLAYVPMAAYMSSQQAASGESWDAMLNGQQDNAGNDYGPQSPSLDFVFNASAQIMNGTILSDYGSVFFAAGNEMYALNLSSGSKEWATLSPYNQGFGTSPSIMSSLLYRGMVVYSTPVNVVAVNARTGQQVWAANTLFTSTDQVSRLFRYYDKIIVQSYDVSSDSLATEILYAENGTILYDSMSTSSNPIVNYAVIGGQIADSTPAKLNLSTGISVKSPPYADIWSTGLDEKVPGMAVYNGSIVYGYGSTEKALSENGMQAFSSDLGSAISGLSVYKGHDIFQAAGEVSQAGIFGYAGWNTIMPSGYGLPVANATPVISLQDVYTLWSNDNIVALNLSIGAILWNTTIPYTGSADPYMALASGRLLVSRGSHLMAYGACPADTSGSLLSAVATLHVNGRGSCASYLLGSVAGASNFGLSINGPVESASYFAGNGRIFDPEHFIPSQSCNITIIAWSNYTGTSSDATHGVITFNSSSPSGITFGTGSAKFEAGSASDTWDASGNFIDSWTMSALVLKKGSNPEGYIDGTGYPDTNTYTGCPGIGNATIGVSSGSYFSGYIADVQAYNSSLSSAQISQLYGEGIAAPPLTGQRLVAWFPLSGGPDNYAFPYSAGYPFNAAFNGVAYNSIAFQNSYSIAAQSAPLAVFNYTLGSYKIYNVGVYSWR